MSKVKATPVQEILSEMNTIQERATLEHLESMYGALLNVNATREDFIKSQKYMDILIKELNDPGVKVGTGTEEEKKEDIKGLEAIKEIIGEKIRVKTPSMISGAVSKLNKVTKARHIDDTAYRSKIADRLDVLLKDAKSNIATLKEAIEVKQGDKIADIKPGDKIVLFFDNQRDVDRAKKSGLIDEVCQSSGVKENQINYRVGNDNKTVARVMNRVLSDPSIDTMYDFTTPGFLKDNQLENALSSKKGVVGILGNDSIGRREQIMKEQDVAIDNSSKYVIEKLFGADYKDNSARVKDAEKIKSILTAVFKANPEFANIDAGGRKQLLDGVEAHIRKEFTEQTAYGYVRGDKNRIQLIDPIDENYAKSDLAGMVKREIAESKSKDLVLFFANPKDMKEAQAADGLVADICKEKGISVAKVACIVATDANVKAAKTDPAYAKSAIYNLSHNKEVDTMPRLDKKVNFDSIAQFPIKASKAAQAEQIAQTQAKAVSDLKSKIDTISENVTQSLFGKDYAGNSGRIADAKLINEMVTAALKGTSSQEAETLKNLNGCDEKIQSNIKQHIEGKLIKNTVAGIIKDSFDSSLEKSNGIQLKVPTSDEKANAVTKFKLIVIEAVKEKAAAEKAANTVSTKASKLFQSVTTGWRSPTSTPKNVSVGGKDTNQRT